MTAERWLIGLAVLNLVVLGLELVSQLVHGLR
jgi:hypothetical protein